MRWGRRPLLLESLKQSPRLPTCRPEVVPRVPVCRLPQPATASPPVRVECDRPCEVKAAQVVGTWRAGALVLALTRMVSLAIPHREAASLTSSPWLLH